MQFTTTAKLAIAPMTSLHEIGQVLERAKAAAIDYYRLTGKPLGITGEIGEYLAAKHLGLDLADARTPGYDAVDRQGRRIQVKARAIPTSQRLSGQRLGSIRLEHDWDIVLLILLDELFEVKAIYEADRPAIEAALTKPGSKARNERGALAVTKFISIGRQVWPLP